MNIKFTNSDTVIPVMTEDKTNLMDIKLVNANAVVPTRGSKYSAGWDLCAAIPSRMIIYPGETFKIPTGIAAAIPNGYFGAIFARSGIASKRGLRPANCVGVVDSDYRGEIMVPLHNDSNDPQPIDSGERIAQLVIMKYEPLELNVVEELDDTERGVGGFGSTGTH